MSRASECQAVVARVEELAALTAHHAQLEEPHLVVCADCRDQVARTRDVLGGLDALPVRPAKGDLTQRVMSRIQAARAPVWAQKAAQARAAVPRAVGGPLAGGRQEPVRKPARDAEAPGFFAWLGGRAFAVPAFGMAAALCLVLVLRPSGPRVAVTRAHGSPIVEEPDVIDRAAPGIAVARADGEVKVFEQGGWKPLAAGGTFAAGQRMQVLRGGRAALTLPDGSTLEVAGDTELVAFAERVRMRRGRARFDVQHRPERIFRVLVPDGEVRVMGTLFDVDAASSATRVHLLQGRLEVQCGTQVERLEDGDGATIATGRLVKLAAASRPAGADAAGGSGAAGAASVASDAGGAGEVAMPPDAPMLPGADPRPAVQATAASGPAPEGLR